MAKEVMIAKIFALQRYFTPVRLKYPWFIGIALWIGWLISIITNQQINNATDRFGQLVGTDFAAFFTAGEIIRTGQTARLYDPDLAIEIQTSLYGYPPQVYNPYLNPPFYAWLFIPFSKIPYPASPLLWMALNLLFLFLALKIIGETRLASFFLSLTWLPAWAAISFGQNTFLSILILSTSLIFWNRDKKFLAGLVAGLLLYKPQLLIGLLFLWIIDWKKSSSALIGFLCTGIFLFGISFLLMPEATLYYFTYLQSISSFLVTHPAFPIWNAHGFQTFWIGIFPDFPWAARLLYLVTVIVGFFVYFSFFKQIKPSKQLLFVTSIILTVWCTPYLMIYDWAILLIPAIILFKEFPTLKQEWRVIYTILWIAMFISGALTALQWRWFGWSIQVSIPAFVVSIYLGLYVIRQVSNNNPEQTLMQT